MSKTIDYSTQFKADFKEGIDKLFDFPFEVEFTTTTMEKGFYCLFEGNLKFDNGYILPIIIFNDTIHFQFSIKTYKDTNSSVFYWHKKLFNTDYDFFNDLATIFKPDYKTIFSFWLNDVFILSNIKDQTKFITMDLYVSRNKSKVIVDYEFFVNHHYQNHNITKKESLNISCMNQTINLTSKYGSEISIDRKYDNLTDRKKLEKMICNNFSIKEELFDLSYFTSYESLLNIKKEHKIIQKILDY